jgi:hypothetical protein
VLFIWHKSIPLKNERLAGKAQLLYAYRAIVALSIQFCFPVFQRYPAYICVGTFAYNEKPMVTSTIPNTTRFWHGYQIGNLRIDLISPRRQATLFAEILLMDIQHFYWDF